MRLVITTRWCRGFSVLTFIGLALLLSSQSVHAVLQGDFPAAVEPFIKKNCSQCHQGEEAKGDFRFDELGRDLSDAETAISWQDAVELVKLGEMPPPEQTPPSGVEISDFIASVENALKTEARKGESGRVAIRRLSHSALENTAKDLLGTRLSLSQGLPADPEVAGFDNMAQTLGQSEEFMNTLQQNARLLSRDVISSLRDPRKKHRFAIKDIGAGRNTTRMKKEIIMWGSKNRYNTIWPAGFSAPRTGAYRIQFRGFREDSRHELKRQGKKYPPTSKKSGLAQQWGWYLPEHNSRFAAIMAMPARDLETGMGGESAGGRRVGEVELANEMDDHSVDVVLEKGENIFIHAIDCPRIQSAPMGVVDGKKILVGELMHLTSLKVEGPLLETWPSKTQQALLPSKKLSANQVVLGSLKLSEGELAGPKAFLTRAFRRPVDAATLRRYRLIYSMGIKAKLNREKAMQNVVEAVLCSPRFLYNFESSTPDGWSIASRLSYFLWNSMPDDELLQLAESGEIMDPVVIKAQVKRMLKDEKVDRFVEDFTGQWLGLRKVGAMPPDPKLYPNFDKALELSIRGESESLFREILNNNLPIKDFLAPRYAMLNERLARHYEIPDVKGKRFRKVSLPKGSPRGGLLGHASMLTITSNGTRTSPVVRGVWVLENMLDSPPSPPPADVEAIEPDVRGAKTIREMLAKHRDVTACKECHRRIDPWGFGLENFDAVGAWRNTYRGKAKKPVDATGTFADGKKFDGFMGLQAALLSKQDRFAHALTAKLISHALGHPPTVSERLEIDEIVAENKQRGSRFADLLVSICTSEVFMGQR